MAEVQDHDVDLNHRVTAIHLMAVEPKITIEESVLLIEGRSIINGGICYFFSK